MQYCTGAAGCSPSSAPTMPPAATTHAPMARAIVVSHTVTDSRGLCPLLVKRVSTGGLIQARIIP